MKLRLLLCAIGLSALSGCVTTSYYADDGYYESPGDGYYGYDDSGYYGDGYYDDRYEDDGYYDAPYGGGTHFSFNLQFGGYGGFIPYGNCWYGDAYCYGQHPRYGWGYWPNPYYSYYGPSYGWPNYGAWPGFGWPYYGYHPPRPPQPKPPKPPKPSPPPVVQPPVDAPVIERPVTRPPRPGFPEAERPRRPGPPKPTPPIPTGESNTVPTGITPLPPQRSERPERPRVRDERPQAPVWNAPPRVERPAPENREPAVRPRMPERPVRIETPRQQDEARGRASLIERQQAPHPQTQPRLQTVIQQPTPAREFRVPVPPVRPAATPKAERPVNTQRSTPAVDDQP